MEEAYTVKDRDLIHPEGRLASDPKFAKSYAEAKNDCSLSEAIKERELRAHHGWPEDLWSAVRAAEFCKMSVTKFRSLCKLGLGPQPAAAGIELFWFNDLARFMADRPKADTKPIWSYGAVPFRSPAFFNYCEQLSKAVSHRVGAQSGLFVTISLAKTQHVKKVRDFNRYQMMHAAARSRLIYSIVNELVHGRGPFRSGRRSTPGLVVPERIGHDRLRLEVPLHFHAVFLFEDAESAEAANAKLSEKLGEKLSTAFGKRRFLKETAADDRANDGRRLTNSSKDLSYDLQIIAAEEMCDVSAYAAKYIYDTLAETYVSM